MTFESLVHLHKAKPYVPFRLALADGQEVDVTHPECVAYNPKGARMITVALPDGGFKLIDLLLVVTAEPINGRIRRRPRR
jgi:hypothetical protein